MKNLLLTFIAVSILGTGAMAQSMTNDLLGRIVESVSDSVSGDNGAWHFNYNDRLMLLITDQTNNRMRLISPIHMADQLSEQQLREALSANFHSALDVRYAISDGVMWSAFIHPLAELSEDQVRDAMSQIYRAAETFGTTYSSTDLVFPGNVEKAKPNSKPKKKKM